MFSGGGWILAAGLLAVAAAFTWSVARWLSSQHRAVGDGKSVLSYGFPLEPCLVPRGTLVASGMTKDGLQALTDPQVWPAVRLQKLTGREYRKLLLADDLVAGVELAGESRAYPLRFLTWHEVVNDTLGGIPIAVTHHPVTGTVAVFNRWVAGETLQFGVSGLLSDSGQVLYDRRADPAFESLWSQLDMRAIAGPAAAAGHALDLLPVTVGPWSWWLSRHPETTLLAPDPRRLSDYRRSPYSSYFGSDLLRYPVDPLPPATGLPLKTPVVAVVTSSGIHAIAAPFVSAGTVEGTRSIAVGGVDLRFHWRGRPTAVWLEQPSPPVPVAYSLLFAWYAAQGPRTSWHGVAVGQ